MVLLVRNLYSLTKTSIRPNLSRFIMQNAKAMAAPTGTNGLPTDASLPGPAFEHREKFPSAEALKPDPSKSLPLDKTRQSLVDDILALYTCHATVERLKRYTPDAVYDDPFSYADNRFQIAGQWFGLQRLFKEGTNNGYEIIKNDRDLIQFKNSMTWTFKVIGNTVSIDSVVSVSLDPDSVDGEFLRVKYHKDQARPEDYEREGLGQRLKEFQAEKTAEWFVGGEGMEEFRGDKKYGGNDRKGD